MPQVLSRVAVAPSPSRAGLAWCATAILSLALLLAAHPGHAAVPATDADVIGKWVADKNDPASDYSVAAGPSAGTLSIMVPAKTVGRPAGETLTLQRVGPEEFATPAGAPIRASFKVTQPRHAEFHLHQNDKKAFVFTYVLLAKQ